METPMRWKNAVRPNPCLDCPNRHPRCHTECADYIAWKAEVTAAAQNIKDKRDREAMLDEQTVAAIRKTKKALRLPP